ncbi:MAG: hypothetical protein K9M10_01125 [Candidatus Pacebacteria bacterium]|nr:hypothetical protein [Candidatus Paceibacterota bacterium]MCF7857065.1 hypothetical protein [Candidatus Paceibacterota bacterium]
MTQKWNLQDIRPAGKPRPTMREAPIRKPRQDITIRQRQVDPELQSFDTELSSIDVIDGNSVKRKRVMITVVVAFFIIGVGFVTNLLLGGADVTVYPKIKDVSVQASFSAYTAPQVDELGYELLTLENSGEKQVKASGKEVVSLRTEGKIFVYNTKGSVSQRLIKNTRFESKDGLVYRINESVEVPGTSTDSNGNIVPGSIAVNVIADGTGEQYNIEPQRFTIPGLEGTPQFESIYGESTTQFTGGFEGEKYIIDEQELNTAKQALHIELRDSLLKKLTEERPAGYVIYDDAVTFAYDSLPSTEYGESLATIKERARLQVPMFKESEFSSYIAENTIPDYTGDPVTLVDFKTLSFAYAGATTSISDIADDLSIDFTLKGSARVVWTFDEEILKNELVSLKKSDSTSVFSKYRSIQEAHADIRPFWETSFPSKPNNIMIKTVIGKE